MLLHIIIKKIFYLFTYMEELKSFFNKNNCKWYNEFDTIDHKYVLELFKQIDENKLHKIKDKNGLIHYLVGCKYYINKKENNMLDAWIESSKRGCIISTNQLGCYYCEKKLMSKAKKYFKLAVEGENVDGFYNLGVVYEYNKDYEYAIKYYKLALNKGHVMSALKLAELHKGNELENKYIALYNDMINKQKAVEKSNNIITMPQFYITGSFETN